jgi:PAS domain S-box-containing protein
MRDKGKTKTQLIEELGKLHKRIAELEATEKEHKKSEERYQDLIEKEKDIIYTLDIEGNITFANPAVNTILRYKQEDIIGRNFISFIPNDSRKKTEADFARLLKTGEIKAETVLLDKNDQPHFMEYSSTVIKEGNKVVGTRGIARDVTKRKLAEEEREMLLKAIEITKEAISVTSPEGVILYTNDAMEELFGYTNGELIGKHVSILNASPEPEDAAKQMIEEIEERGYWEGEVQNKRKDDTEFLSYATISALRNKEGKILNVVSTQHDITKIAEMKEQLGCKEKLAVLGQLAGGVGHELRNPLGAIKNAVYFLNIALEEPDPEIKETVDLLMKEVKTSERIISSLLDFAGAKPPIRHKTDLNKIVQEELSRNAVPENIKVVSQMEEKLPAILADPDQISQIFSNIILNAIQAMPLGGKLIVRSKSENPQQVTISFTDKGEGIPRENLKKLFEPLFTTKAKGIGLGLAVTKILVEGHGGTIEVDSEVNKGSKFSVRMPVVSKS